MLTLREKKIHRPPRVGFMKKNENGMMAFRATKIRLFLDGLINKIKKKLKCVCICVRE